MSFSRPFPRAMVIAIVACMALSALAQSFPSRPIKLVVPYGAGGTGDVEARILASKASEYLGQPILVDNKSGGGGMLGAQAVAQSSPDGYTLIQLSTGHIINPSLQPVPYDWKAAFTPLMGLSAVPQVLAVNANSNIRSIADLVAVAKATPKGLSYASGGTGSLSHLTGALLVSSLKLNAEHVAYRGLAPATNAVLNGETQFTIVNMPDVLELAKAGKLRLLGVTTDERQIYLPELPTLKEQGLDIVGLSIRFYLVPAGTPSQVNERLYSAFSKAIQDPGVQEKFGKMGVVFKVMNGADLGRFLQAQSEQWRKVIEVNRITVN